MAPLLRLSLAVLLTLAAAPVDPAAPGPGAGLSDPKTEDGLRSALDPIEARYESACVRMNQARWSLLTGSSPANRGQLEAARAELAAIFSDPALDHALAAWSRRTTVSQDPALTRRVDLWLRGREAAAIELQPEIFTLANDLADKIVRHRFDLDGRKVTMSELRRVVASDPDRETRRKAWMAEARFAAELRPDAGRLIRMRAVEAQKRDSKYFHRLIYHGRSVDDYWAYSMMQQAAARTKPGYDNLRALLEKETGIESLQPWDLEYALSSRTSRRGLDEAIGRAFPAGGAPAAASRLLKSLGFDMDKAPIKVSALPLGFGAAFGMAISIPTEELLAIDAPVAAEPVGGPEPYEAVLRKYGLVLMGANTRQKSPILKGYDCVTGTLNGVYAEGMAGAIGDFVRDKLFLREQLGMETRRLAPFLEDQQDRALVRLRALLADLGFEYAAYVNPDADLDARYRELYARSLGTNQAPEGTALWPASLDIILRPGAALDALIGLTISPEVHARFAEEFGDDRLRPGKVAPWLIEKCYADGELVDLQDRLVKSVHGGFNLDKYLASPARLEKK